MATQLIVGMQHFIAMFGATILVPILTGFPISVALFTSGVGTLIFHGITNNKVPAYLGSSFAFIAPISLVMAEYGGVETASGGIIVAGLVYVLVSYLIKYGGSDNLEKVLPPVVTAPIIMIIGLSLAPVAINSLTAGGTVGIVIGIITLASAIATAIFGSNFLKTLPVLVGVAVGYVVAGLFGLVDMSSVASANIVGMPGFVIPQFDLSAIMIIAPVAIVTIVEHVGDVLAIGETVDNPEIISDPGLDKTLLGDGLATILAGALGGLPNTTYGENTGVLALTGIHDSSVVRMGALFAILASFVPKLEQLLMGIPDPVIGGISILLFGMITAIGIRTLVKSDTNMENVRNLIIVSVILIVGLGGAVVSIGVIEISSMALASISGIVLNLILPKRGE